MRGRKEGRMGEKERGRKEGREEMREGGRERKKRKEIVSLALREGEIKKKVL
jgi:hypothetical protein